jgi:hypothetical protein
VIRFLAGVRGAGKTTLVPQLVAAATGFVVLDMDEVLEDGCAMGVPIAFSEARGAWPAYNRHWALLASLIERSAPVLLLGPLLPSEWAAAGGDPSTQFALLDVADDVRRERLSARGWSEDEIADALVDADEARAEIPHVVHTLDDVLNWLR